MTDAVMVGMSTAAAMGSSLAVAIAVLAAKYKIFTKMGQKGWKSLIPFYSEYLMFKHVWNTKAFKALLANAVVAGIGQAILSVVTTAGAAFYTGMALTAVSSVITLVMAVMFASRMSRAFGHGKKFAVGLLFLDPLFTMILGFGKSEYAAA